MQAINDFILDAAGQSWVFPLLRRCCLIDGFFPPVPSESVVVALAAIAVSAGVPNPFCWWPWQPRAPSPGTTSLT